MDNEEVPSAPSTPATPGTPGAPLFGGFKAERSGNGRRSLLKNCKCFSVEEWAMEEGTLPKLSCSLPPPPVPLAKKVTYFSLSLSLPHTHAHTEAPNDQIKTDPCFHFVLMSKLTRLELNS